MRLPPLEVLYSWPDPNYVNPVTRGSALLVVNCVFVSIAVLFVGARLYTRLWVKSWFGLDDVFIILAMVCIHTAVLFYHIYLLDLTSFPDLHHRPDRRGAPR